MPIGGELYRNVLSEPIGSQLPSIGAIGGFRGLNEHVQREWTERSADIAHEGARQTLAAVATSIGVPTSQIVQLGGQAVRMVDAVAGAMGSKGLAWEVGQAISTAILQAKLAKDAVGAAADIIATVPVLGVFAEMILGVVTNALGELRRAEQLREQLADVAQAFNPEADRIFYDGLRRTLAGQVDWTDVFSPPVFDIGAKNPWVAERLKGNGVRLRALGYQPGTYGQIPGTDVLTNTIEVLPYPSSRRPFVVRDTGSLLPTARQQATWVWGLWANTSVVPQNAAAYTIAPAELAERWRRYLYTLRVFLAANRTAWWSGHARIIVDHYRPIFGWSPWDAGSSSRRQSTAWGTSFGLWDARNPFFRAIEDVDRVQSAGLGGLAALYVAPTYPGISSRRQQWETAVRDVLARPEVKAADPANVPVAELRSEVAARGATGSEVRSVSITLNGARPRATKIAAVGSGNTIAAVPQATRNVGGIRTFDSHGDGGGGAGLVAALAGLGAAVWAWRRAR